MKKFAWAFLGVLLVLLWCSSGVVLVLFWCCSSVVLVFVMMLSCRSSAPA
jgi:hypothetical protein